MHNNNKHNYYKILIEASLIIGAAADRASYYKVRKVERSGIDTISNTNI